MKKKLYKFFLSVAYVGYFPSISGTMGSVAALLLFLPCIAFLANGRWLVFFVALLFFLLAMLSLPWALKHLYTDKDPAEVVIDEVVGMAITLLALPSYSLGHAGSWLAWAFVGFVLFRIFDITKPLFIKKLENLPGAWGIMLDDVAAGLVSAFFLWLLVTLF